MKNYFLVLFLFCVSIIDAQNFRNVKVVYKIQLEKKSEPSNKNPELQKLIQDIELKIQNLTFELYANQEASIFNVVSEMTIDDNQRAYRIAKAQVKGKYIYYKDQNTKLMYGESFGDNMIIQEPKNKYSNWKISSETKNILGYKCFKAVTTYQSIDRKGERINVPVEAWFTPAIPINTGPVGLDGLPGLILEGYLNPKFVYKATEVTINPKEFKLIKPEADIILTREEYRRKVQKALEIIRDRG